MNRVFVGRQAELEQLAELAARAQSDQPQTVFLDGEAGAGKTALLDAFAATLTSWHCLYVAADEGESALPFGVLNRLRSRAATVARTARCGDEPAGEDPFAAMGRLAAEIGELQQTRPTALIVDDVHWADPASLHTMTLLLRRLEADHVLAVLSARSDVLAPLHPGLIRHMHDRGHLITLVGLSIADIREMVDQMSGTTISGAAAQRLRDHTHGNPLHLEALLRELPIEELVRNDGVVRAPSSFERLVTASLAKAPTPVRRLLSAASVLGSPCELRLAAAVARLKKPLDVLEGATATGLVTAVQGPDGWMISFAHPLNRSAVYGAIGPKTRAELHTRAAEMMPDPERLDHLVATGDPNLSADLVRQLTARCELEIAAHRPIKAAQRLLTAARLDTVGPARDLHALRAVDLMLQSGDVSSAAAHMDMIENAQDTSLKSIVQARLAFLSGNAGEAERLAARAWEAGTTEDRAAASALIAQLKVLQGANAEAAAWAKKAAASADLPPTVRSDLRAMAATAVCLDNRAAEGLRQLSDLPTDPALVEPSRQSELTTRGILRMVEDDWAGARDDLRAASMDGTGSRLTPKGLMALATLGDVEFRLGDWDESLAHTQQALALVTDTRQLWLLAFMHAMIVLVLAGRGKFDAAQRHVTLAKRAAAEVGDSASAMYAADSAVHLAACRGDGVGVLQEAAPLAAEPSPSPSVLGVLSWRPIVAAALVSQRRLDEADEALDALERDANDRGHRSTLAVISRIRGELAATRGDVATARFKFREAVQARPGVATALDQARAHASYGRFLRRRGERRAAADQLRVAHGSFVKLGAQAHLDRLQTELAACGIGAGPGRRTERLSLTPQELAIARLVCRGMTNREVAAELVLSVKTIGYHLGNVYGKLGVNSRTQLAARLLGPEPPAN